MSREQLLNQGLSSKLHSFYRKNRQEILDILIFGSVTRGKKSPKDVDILVVFKEKEDNELEYVLRKELKSIPKTEITSRTYKSLFDPSFLPREYILSEAYSIRLKKTLSEAFGYVSYVMFNYTLENFTPTKRTQFHYSLHGRGTEGILEKIGGLKVSGVVLVPTGKSDMFIDFLDAWDISFKKIPVLVPKKSISYKEILI